MQHELGLVLSDDLHAAVGLSSADTARAGAWLLKQGSAVAVMDILSAGATQLDCPASLNDEPVRRMIMELDILDQLSDEVYGAMNIGQAVLLGGAVVAALIANRDDERPIWILGDDVSGRPIRVRHLRACRVADRAASR